jgi:hypothetical protein
MGDRLLHQRPQPVGCQKSMATVTRVCGLTGLRYVVARLAFVVEGLVVWLFVYLALRRVLELVVLCCRSAEAKEIEILVLRHELSVAAPPASTATAAI